MTMADEKASPTELHEAPRIDRSNSSATTVPATTPELQAMGFQAATVNVFSSLMTHAWDVLLFLIAAVVFD